MGIADKTFVEGFRSEAHTYGDGEDCLVFYLVNFITYDYITISLYTYITIYLYHYILIYLYHYIPI